MIVAWIMFNVREWGNNCLQQCFSPYQGGDPRAGYGGGCPYANLPPNPCRAHLITKGGRVWPKVIVAPKAPGNTCLTSLFLHPPPPSLEPEDSPCGRLQKLDCVSADPARRVLGNERPLRSRSVFPEVAIPWPVRITGCPPVTASQYLCFQQDLLHSVCTGGEGSEALEALAAAGKFAPKAGVSTAGRERSEDPKHCRMQHVKVQSSVHRAQGAVCAECGTQRATVPCPPARS